ncbi:MAG: hypothetical protein WAX20_01355, partial [Enterococcus aquimarinus]
RFVYFLSEVVSKWINHQIVAIILQPFHHEKKILISSLMLEIQSLFGVISFRLNDFLHLFQRHKKGNESHE